MIEENEDIYSLEIEVDDEIIDETGVEVISFVEDPAVQIDFHYFNEEKFVEPKVGEDKDEFIGRCMSSLNTEFPDEKQRFAVCQSMWEDQFCDGDCPIEDENVKLYVDSVLELASSDEYGLQLTPDDVILDMSKTEFGVDEIIKAIRGLNFLKRKSVSQDQEAEVYWKYSGRPAQRTFCKGMMRLSKSGKIFSRKEIERMSRKSWQPRMGPRGANTYDLFRFCGGVSCVHFWSKMLVFKSDSGRKVVIEGNPTTFDEEQAMSSQNQKYPSPYGYITNNARVQLEKQMFALDDEKREVVGVVMIPRKRIKRVDEYGNTFSIVFSENTIRKMSEKFFRDGVHNNTDQNHDFNISTKNTLLESWIVEDPEHDKSKLYGFDVPQGTWLVKYKIHDDKLWSDIKRGIYKGFSLAGSFVKKLLKKKREEQQFEAIVKILENVDFPD